MLPFFNVKTNFLKIEWNNLDTSIRNSSSCHNFKKLILKFIRPEPNRISSTRKFEGFINAHKNETWFEAISRSQI